MPVKFYNLTRLPDEPMRSLLTMAMRLAGAKGGVVSKITRGGRGGGEAMRANFVYAWFVGKRPKAGGLGRKIATRGGMVTIRLYNSHDSLISAQEFFETAIHEYAHIRDYQGGFGRGDWSHRNGAGRRPKHDTRPEEIRAINCTDEALARLGRDRIRRSRVDELIIELAIQMEGR